MVSSLAVKKVDLEGDLGDALGLGFGPIGGDPEWSVRDARRIRRSVQSGLRSFYFCGHNWSFLRQNADLVLPQGATTLKLPDDFGGVDGMTRVLVSRVSDLQGQTVLRFEGPGTVQMALQLSPQLTGWPSRIAMRPIKTIAVGQIGRDEILVAPIPDTDYQLTFQYQVTPDYLVNETQPYFLASTECHEAILALCKAAAEKGQDDKIGVQSADAQQALSKAIRIDRLKQPQKLGYNRDLSDAIHDHTQWIERQWPNYKGGVLYNGQLFDE